MIKHQATLLCTVLIVSFLFRANAHAEVKIIEAEAVYTMGDNDSKLDARRIVVQEAQRNALGQAGVYVSGLTQVKDFQLTKDEVTAYTAGVLETETLLEEMRGTADRPSFYVKTKCRIDTDVLIKQIEQFRDNEELKEQLVASQKEYDLLKKERDGLLARLAKSTDEKAIEQHRRKLDQVLTKEETNSEVMGVWSRYTRNIDFNDPSKHETGSSTGEMDNAIAALDRAVSTFPRDARARILLTYFHEARGDPDAAEKQLRTAITANPTIPLFRMKLGLFLERQDRHEEALKEFLAYERLRPHDPLVLFYIGITYKNMDQCRQSAVNLKRFLKATEYRTSPRVMAMKKDATGTIKECEGKPRGPGSRQSPIRKVK